MRKKVSKLISSDTTGTRVPTAPARLLLAPAGAHQFADGNAPSPSTLCLALTVQSGNLATMMMTREEYYFTSRSRLDPRYTGAPDKIKGALWEIMSRAIQTADVLKIDLGQVFRSVYANELDHFRNKEPLKTRLSHRVDEARSALEALEAAVRTSPEPKTLAEVIVLKRASMRVFSLVEPKKWGPEACFMELAKQTGELTDLIQKGSTPHQIGDEIADVINAIIRLADVYQLALEER